MFFRKKKNNLNTLILYFNLMIKWGKSQKKNFIIANMLMLVVAAVTSLYPIAIDYSFNALNSKNVTNLMYIPIGIIALTFLKGIAYFYQTVVVGKISNSIIKVIQLRLYEKIVNFDVLLINEVYK